MGNLRVWITPEPPQEGDYGQIGPYDAEVVTVHEDGRVTVQVYDEDQGDRLCEMEWAIG